MSAHSTTYMNNGHTLTVTEDTNGRTFHVIERDETGGLVHIYPCDSLAQANAMVEERAPMTTSERHTAEAEAWARRVDSDTLAAMLSAGAAMREQSPYYAAARREWDRRENATMPTASERIRAAREQRDGEPDAAGLAVVVFDMGRDGAPMPLGLFIRHDEDVVIYENSHGEYAQAPYDCVKVKRVRL